MDDHLDKGVFAVCTWFLGNKGGKKAVEIRGNMHIALLNH